MKTMHSVVCFLLISSATCFARYRGIYDSLNDIGRNEHNRNIEGQLVECPVCEDSGYWLPSNEKCTVMKGKKQYKKCPWGIYVNEVCGGRLDCYRGPGEQCTEKMEYDVYGQKCAPGLYCNKPMSKCQGMEYVVDSKEQFLVNPNTYSLERNALKERSTDYILDAIRN